MDIQHSLDATAVVTLGKDMTFRDYVQGSFRMRQIGIGQKCEVYVIPEVAQLIERELSCTEMVRTDDNMLEQITAWLVIASMRSERVQSNQLLVQVPQHILCIAIRECHHSWSLSAANLIHTSTTINTLGTPFLPLCCSFGVICTI